MNQEPTVVLVIREVIKGLKDLIYALGMLATIWVQVSNAGKIDTAAAKTEVVESKLETTNAEHKNKLDEIAAAAAASVKNWKAYKTKDPEDMNEADAAIAAAEKNAK